MSNECPKEYKNIGLNRMEEGRHVTWDMLRQFCKNDAYLKGEVEDLWDTTPPVTRKTFKPISIDHNKSFGVGNIRDNTYVRFSNETNKDLLIDFTDNKMVDASKSTAEIVFSTPSTPEEPVIPMVRLPKQSIVASLDKTTRDEGPYGDMVCNEFWYIGYDHNRVYETRPNWLNNHENGEIPSVCRAQTFKAKVDGTLETVVLNLHGTYNTGSPLYVEITECENHGTTENPDYYPASRATINGEQFEGVTYKAKQLARQEVTFTNTDPGVYNVTFDLPCTVKAGEIYAIVLRSPLTHPDTSYHIGGWSKHCDTEIYADGDAFLSENNGYNWLKYGKGEDVPYHAGKYAPQDFAFVCHIRPPSTSNYKSSAELVSKPFLVNPLYNIVLEHYEKNNDGEVNYYFKTPEMEDWQSIDISHQFTSDNPNVIILKAVLSLSDVTKDSPIITKMGLELTMHQPKEAILRSASYYPRKDGILACNVYSGLGANYILDNNPDLGNTDLLSCTVDLVRDYPVSEHYNIIYARDIPSKYHQYGFVSEHDNEWVRFTTDEEFEEYLDNNPSIVENLKTYGVYVKGVGTTSTGDVHKDYFEKIKFINSPAYPLISCVLTEDPVYSEDGSVTAGQIKEFSEWLDYKVDYTEDTLQFINQDNIKTGYLTINYNPLFVKDLTNKDMPFKLDLITDNLPIVNGSLYHITEADILNADIKVTYRAIGLDPLREVALVHWGTDSIEDYSPKSVEVLQENVDYTVDYTAKTITFIPERIPTIFQVEDTIRVKYTPYLTDDSVSLMYHLKRDDTSKDIELEPCWFEYKT